LNFKIISVHKSQISIFKEGLNLFEFENIFLLELKLWFQIQISSKSISKVFAIFLASPSLFGPFPSPA
jgi:hypothetical protein